MKKELKPEVLRDSIVTNIFENENGSLIGLWFEKENKKYQLKIKGFECETLITEVT